MDKKMMINCLYFKDGKCTREIEPTAECNNCDKPTDTCVLLCECEEETCNIGNVEPSPEPMPLIDYSRIHDLAIEFFKYLEHWIPETHQEQVLTDLQMVLQKVAIVQREWRCKNAINADVDSSCGGCDAPENECEKCPDREYIDTPAHDQQVRKDLIEEIQKYIDANNIYQVIFGHYEDLYKWVPLQTKKINLEDICQKI